MHTCIQYSPPLVVLHFCGQWATRTAVRLPRGGTAIWKLSDCLTAPAETWVAGMGLVSQILVRSSLPPLPLNGGHERCQHASCQPWTPSLHMLCVFVCVCVRVFVCVCVCVCLCLCVCVCVCVCESMCKGSHKTLIKPI